MNQCRALTIGTRQKVTGWYCQVESKHYIIFDVAFIEENDYELNRGIESFVRVDPETVGQQTGLKDKNGKEIYEWDKVVIFGKYYTVMWNQREAGWYLQDEYKAEIKLSHINCHDCKIEND